MIFSFPLACSAVFNNRSISGVCAHTFGAIKTETSNIITVFMVFKVVPVLNF